MVLCSPHIQLISILPLFFFLASRRAVIKRIDGLRSNLCDLAIRNQRAPQLRQKEPRLAAIAWKCEKIEPQNKRCVALPSVAYPLFAQSIPIEVLLSLSGHSLFFSSTYAPGKWSLRSRLVRMKSRFITLSLSASDLLNQRKNYLPSDAQKDIKQPDSLVSKNRRIYMWTFCDSDEASPSRHANKRQTTKRILLSRGFLA